MSWPGWGTQRNDMVTARPKAEAAPPAAQSGVQTVPLGGSVNGSDMYVPNITPNTRTLAAWGVL